MLLSVKKVLFPKRIFLIQLMIRYNDLINLTESKNNESLLF